MVLLSAIIIFFGLIFWGTLNVVAYAINKKLSLAVSNCIAIYCPQIIFSTLSLLLGFKLSRFSDYRNELPDQFLVLSNHQSLIDIPLYLKFMPEKNLRFVAKAELGRYVPVASEMLRAQQHALVNRTGSAAAAMKELDTFADRVKKNNWCPVLFPEGSRSRDGNLISFKPAGFRRLMEKAPMPVAVCVLDGGYKIASIAGMLKNIKGGSYRVKILKIFPAPKSKAEQIQILEEAKLLMENQLKQWRA